MRIKLITIDILVHHELACSAYVRYMDDVALWGTRRQVRAWRSAAITFLDEQLGLPTKCGGFINRSEHGFDFLGYRVFPDRLRLSRRAARRLQVNTRRLEQAFRRGMIGEDELQRRATAVFAFAASAASKDFRRRVVRETLLPTY